MKAFLRLLLVVLNLGVSTPSVWAASGTMPDEFKVDEVKAKGSVKIPQTLRGELLKIEGQFYVVKEASGDEFRLMVDDRTTLIGNLQPGAKIEAQVMEDGYATSIKEVRG